jgi:hypothetical protein
MSLSLYWPTREEISHCIRSEAETVDEAVLLAVHQPTPLVRREVGSQIERPATDQDLLRQFITDDLPTGTLVMPITGASGVGKSHLIRWLDAQLRRTDGGKNFLVIRIPKSVSLRGVVELILEPLKDPRYAKAKSELKRAVAEVRPEDAAIRFGAEIEIALRELAARLTADLHASPATNRLATLRSELDHALRLPIFLNDPVIREHFRQDIFPRIIKRALHGRSLDDESNEDEQFTAIDFDLPSNIDVTQAAQPVKLYYELVLKLGNGKGRAQAATVLNKVVDEAIRRLFRLGEAIGGITLQEIILQIRQNLLHDNRELVLLIEDFAALAGIQETLLSVIIHEAVRDGRQEFATMRTALAVTEGTHLAHRDTILTRAKSEWVIKDVLDSDGAVIDHVQRLVSAYLNAGRWGEASLQHLYKQSARGKHKTYQVQTFHDEGRSEEESRILAAFGYGADDIPLFPFNKEAIKFLTRRHLMVGGRLVFNPRLAINNILRECLRQHRSEFEQNQFPPQDFEQARASAAVASWINTQPASTSGRYESLIVVWGDNPTSLDQVARIPPEIFRAFGLSRPDTLGQAMTTTQTAAKSRQTTPTKPAATKPADDELDKIREKLDAWSRDTELPHVDANMLRTELAKALTNYIDWNSLRLSSAEYSVEKSNIVIPNARGNPTGQDVIQLCEDHSDRSGAIRAALIALIRFKNNEYEWDYLGADDDAVRIAQLLENLAAEAIKLIEARVQNEIRPLTVSLITQSRILGLAPHRLKTALGLIQAVSFNPSPATQSFAGQSTQQSVFDDRWEKLRGQTELIRRQIQRLLIERAGCFQGTGNKPYGIDAMRVFHSYAEQDKSDQSFESFSPDVRNHIRALSDDRVRPELRPFEEKLKSLRHDLNELLGQHFDKNDVVSSFKSVVLRIYDLGMWPSTFSMSHSQFDLEIEAFRSAPIKELLTAMAQMQDTIDKRPVAETLEVMGKLSLPVLALMQRFVVRTRDFLEQSERRVAAEETTLQDSDAGPLVLELESELRSLTAGLVSLGEEKK